MMKEEEEDDDEENQLVPELTEERKKANKSVCRFFAFLYVVVGFIHLIYFYPIVQDEGTHLLKDDGRVNPGVLTLLIVSGVCWPVSFVIGLPTLIVFLVFQGQ